jgi:hypothetical protein
MGSGTSLLGCGASLDRALAPPSDGTPMKMGMDPVSIELIETRSNCAYEMIS